MIILQKKLSIVKPTFDWYGYKGIPETLAKEKRWITNPDYYIAQYDGAIRTVDAEIGKLLKILTKQHLSRKTKKNCYFSQRR